MLTFFASLISTQSFVSTQAVFRPTVCFDTSLVSAQAVFRHYLCFNPIFVSTQASFRPTLLFPPKPCFNLSFVSTPALFQPLPCFSPRLGLTQAQFQPNALFRPSTRACFNSTLEAMFQPRSRFNRMPCFIQPKPCFNRSFVSTQVRFRLGPCFNTSLVSIPMFCFNPTYVRTQFRFSVVSTQALLRPQPYLFEPSPFQPELGFDPRFVATRLFLSNPCI